MSTDTLTAAEIVAASEGRESEFLPILREALDQITFNLRARVRVELRALEVQDETIEETLSAEREATPQPKRQREARVKPVAPADDAELLGLLLAELDWGKPLTAKALARRTGANTTRITSLLHTVNGDVIALHGLKWSRKAAT